MNIFKFGKDMANFCRRFSQENNVPKDYYKWVDLPQTFLKLFKKLTTWLYYALCFNSDKALLLIYIKVK